MFQILTPVILVSMIASAIITIPNALGQMTPDLKIVSFSDYVDSIDILHVVGEVENSSPSLVSFVQVVGTFYDGNNKVAGTSLTYTTPADIGPGGKAPFNLMLTSASVPINQISNYSLLVSHQ